MDARAWDERYEGTDLLWSAEANRFLVAEVEHMPPGDALDLGCGEGRNAVWLAERGWQVTGVDFSPVGLDKARRLAAARDVEVEWLEADLFEWAPPEATFDLVLWLYLHPPPERRHELLTRFSAALRPGSVMLVVGHHVENLEHGVGGPPYPEILLDPDDIAEGLRVAGLEIEKAERVLRPVTTDEGERTAIDTLVRARRPG